MRVIMLSVSKTPSHEVQLQGFEVLFEVGEALDVFGHLLVLRIGNEDDAIHAAEHELAGGVVNDLAGNGVKLELGLEALDRHGFDRQEVEEQRAVGTGGQRDELAFIAGGGLDVVVDLHEVGGLAAHGWAVIHEFNLQLFCCLIDYRHKILLFSSMV